MWAKDIKLPKLLVSSSLVKVKKSILNPEFSWNLTPWVSNHEENLKITGSYYFTHMFYSGLYVDPQSHVFVDILNQLDIVNMLMQLDLVDMPMQLLASMLIPMIMS